MAEPETGLSDAPLYSPQAAEGAVDAAGAGVSRREHRC